VVLKMETTKITSDNSDLKNNITIPKMPSPKTKYVELRLDTIEQLIDLLNNPGDFNSYEPPMSYERRMATAARLKND